MISTEQTLMVNQFVRSFLCCMLSDFLRELRILPLMFFFNKTQIKQKTKHAYTSVELYGYDLTAYMKTFSISAMYLVIW